MTLRLSDAAAGPAPARYASSVPGARPSRLPGLGDLPGGRRGRPNTVRRRSSSGSRPSDVDERHRNRLRCGGGVARPARGVLAAAWRRHRRRTPPAAPADARSPQPRTQSPSCRLAAGDIGLSAERVPETADRRAHRGRPGSALALNTPARATSSRRWPRGTAASSRYASFVADASHELRTPLTTIAGLHRARPQARGPTTDPRCAPRWTRSQEESARMTALVEDLLLLARLDAGRPLAAEAGRPDPAAARAPSTTRASLAPVAHVGVLELPEEAEPIEVHRRRPPPAPGRSPTCSRNARASTRPPGTVVTVTGRVPDGFDVHDDGPGFPAELVAYGLRAVHARRRRPVTASDGAGLGLALVQAIVGGPRRARDAGQRAGRHRRRGPPP